MRNRPFMSVKIFNATSRQIIFKLLWIYSLKNKCMEGDLTFLFLYLNAQRCELPGVSLKWLLEFRIPMTGGFSSPKKGVLTPSHPSTGMSSLPRSKTSQTSALQTMLSCPSLRIKFLVSFCYRLLDLYPSFFVYLNLNFSVQIIVTYSTLNYFRLFAV